MRTEYLKYLLIVAQEKSISRASKKLHMNHQSLSRIIRNLEIEFSTEIFFRDTSGVEPTNNGKIILEKVSTILETLDELMQLIQTSPQDPFSEEKELYIHVAFGIQSKKYIEKLTLFSKENPFVNIYYYENSYSEILQLIQEKENHVGILQRINRPNKPMQPEIPNNTKFIPINHDKFFVLCSKKHPLAKNSSTSLKKLQSFPFVYYCPFYSEQKPLEPIFSPLKPPKIKHVINDLNALFNILKDNQCLSIAGGNVLNEFSETDLIKIPIRYNITQTIGLLISSDEINNPIIQSYIKFFSN